MSTPPPNPLMFYRFACLFEAALAVLAALLGWMMDINPFEALLFNETALINGLLSTLPMLALFFILRRLPIPALQQIQQLLRNTLGKPLVDRNWLDLLVLASIAGFSEELLFRGTLQPWLEQLSNPLAALLISNIVFALVHAITPLYAVLALLMGLYLGWSLDFGAQRNLLQPMVLHGLYDFVAFLVIVGECRRLQRTAHED